MDGWRTAAEDALDAIDTLTDALTDALGGAGEELAQCHAAVVAATAEARWHLGIAVGDQAPGRNGAALAPVARGP